MKIKIRKTPKIKKFDWFNGAYRKVGLWKSWL